MSSNVTNPENEQKQLTMTNAKNPKTVEQGQYFININI